MGKKILIYGMSENNGGIETVIFNYYTLLVKNGYKVDFISSSNRISREEEIKALGSKVFHVSNLLHRPWKYYNDVKNILRKEKYDVVWSNQMILGNLIVLFIAKCNKVKIRIIHGHARANEASRVRGVIHVINKKFFVNLLGTHFWAVSKESADFFFDRKTQNSSNFAILPNCVDMKRLLYQSNLRPIYREKYGLKQKDKMIFMNGRLQYPKNPNIIIKALYEILKKDDNWVVFFAGEGKEHEELVDLSESLEIAAHVKFCGLVTSQEVFELMEAADVFAMPSFHEGLPMAFLEAQANGLPCVISTNISNEAIMCKNILKISPYATPNEWAEALMSSYNAKRGEAVFIESKKRYFDMEETGIQIVEMLG